MLRGVSFVLRDIAWMLLVLLLYACGVFLLRCVVSLALCYVCMRCVVLRCLRLLCVVSFALSLLLCLAYVALFFFALLAPISGARLDVRVVGATPTVTTGVVGATYL